MRQAAKQFSWRRNLPKRMRRVEWRSQRCEIIRMRTRNFGPRFASTPPFMKPTTFTDVPAWHKESTKKQSNGSSQQRACGQRIIRRFASWEWLIRDSDTRPRLLPHMLDRLKLPKSNSLLIPAMCAHSTWEPFAGRELAEENKLLHGRQERWRWIRKIPPCFITWPASTRCCIAPKTP